jgi:DNA-binding NarL/FixJ family response regulator
MPPVALASPFGRSRTYEDDIDDLLRLWLRRPANALSPREWEVAVLIARGWSSRQIAAELVLSDRTVETHVNHILVKLALHSRSQIAAWVMVEHQRRTALRPTP